MKTAASGVCVTDRLLFIMSPIGYLRLNVTDRLLLKMSPIGYIGCRGFLCSSKPRQI